MHTRLLIFSLLFLAFQPGRSQTPEALYESADFDGCIKACSRLIDKKEDLSLAYLYRAMAWSRKGDDGQCRECMLKSINDIASYLLKDASGTLVDLYELQIDSIHANCYKVVNNDIAVGQTATARKLLEQLLKMEVLPMHLYWSARVAEADGDLYTATSTMNKAAKMVYLDWKSGVTADIQHRIIFEALSELLARYNDMQSAIQVALRQRTVFPDGDCSGVMTLLLSNRTSFLEGCNTDSIPLLFLTALDSLEKDCGNAVMAVKDSVWKTCFFDNYRLTQQQKMDLLKGRGMERADVLAAAFLLQIERETKLYHSKGSVSGQIPNEAVESYMDLMAGTSGNASPISPLPKLRELAATGDYLGVARIYHALQSSGYAAKPMVLFGDSLQTVILQQLKKGGYDRTLYLVSLVLPHAAKQDREYSQIAGAYIATLLEKELYSEAGILLKQELAAHPDEQYIHELYQEWVVADYRANYLGSDDDHLYEWTGNVATCQAGDLPASSYDAVLQRLNYVRRLVGLPDSCEWNEEWNAACMEAALMMTAADDLDHHPDKSWPCYSASGAQAAGNSNLSLGYGGVDALMGQVYDYGGSNKAAGHRRWILNPYRRVFGMGSTPEAMALWVLGGNNSSWKAGTGYYHRGMPVAWPPEHYVPEELRGYRWSFSLEGADFQQSSVTVKRNGKAVDITVHEPDDGYGLNTLVWDVQDGQSSPENGVWEYTVEVRGVQIDGETRHFSYNVIFIPVDGL